MNTITKMRRANQKVRKYFESCGFLVHIIHHSRFSKDIFGLFDGFYIDPEGETVYFQIKSNKMPTLKPYKDFKEKYNVKRIQLINVRDRQKHLTIKEV